MQALNVRGLFLMLFTEFSSQDGISPNDSVGAGEPVAQAVLGSAWPGQLIGKVQTAGGHGNEIPFANFRPANHQLAVST